MNRTGRLFTKALVAVVAIAATASSARADIFLRIETIPQDPFTSSSVAYFDLTQAGAINGTVGTVPGANTLLINNANFSGMTGTSSIDVSYGTSTTTTAQSITLNAFLKSDGSSNNYKFNLFSSNFSAANGGTFAQGSVSGPTPLNGVGGLYTAPGVTNDTSYLQTSLSNVTYTRAGGDTSSIFEVTASSTYAGYNGSNNTITTTKTDSGIQVNSNTTSATGTTLLVGPRDPRYDISSNEVNVKLGLNSNLEFHSTATLMLPEPSGVAAAFAGLPCVGFLLGFARRLRRPAPPADTVA
jgi:hypothetical protein